jgi:ornithine cyclodeaminase
MTPAFLGPDAEDRLDWLALTDALAEGHTRPRAEIGDTFLYRGTDTILNRAAWIDGLGALVKTATVFPGNGARDLPSINGAASLFDDATGRLEAMVDFHLLTKWKTAGDSLLAARRLARSDSRRILICGAGAVARSLVSSYGALFPDATFTFWNRTPNKAAGLAAELGGNVEADLETAVRAADIIAGATMATEPWLQGAWLQPGQHIDLIGAYRHDMREADDEALRCSLIFVDSRETTQEHIGEIAIPLKAGTISEADIVASHYEPEAMVRRNDREITLFKNGGGAHLDLMTAAYILRACG